LPRFAASGEDGRRRKLKSKTVCKVTSNVALADLRSIGHQFMRENCSRGVGLVDSALGLYREVFAGRRIEDKLARRLDGYRKELDAWIEKLELERATSKHNPEKYVERLLQKLQALADKYDRDKMEGRKARKRTLTIVDRLKSKVDQIERLLEKQHDKKIQNGSLVGSFNAKLTDKGSFKLPTAWYTMLGRPTEVYIKPMAREKCVVLVPVAERKHVKNAAKVAVGKDRSVRLDRKTVCRSSLNRQVILKGCMRYVRIECV